MRILIISDTHGRHGNFDKVIERVGKIDMLIHAGDVEDETYIEAVVDCPIHMVAGNNDYFSYLPKEKEFSIGKYNIFLTHGHNYHVSMDTRYIKEEARARKANVVIYGHTHRPDVDIRGDVIAINPGSLSYPRQIGREATYVLMEIGDNGTAKFTSYTV